MLTQLTTERTILFVEIYKLKKLKVCEKWSFSKITNHKTLKFPLLIFSEDADNHT
jgi:hypothetical protein